MTCFGWYCLSAMANSDSVLLVIQLWFYLDSASVWTQYSEHCDFGWMGLWLGPCALANALSSLLHSAAVLWLCNIGVTSRREVSSCHTFWKHLHIRGNWRKPYCCQEVWSVFAAHGKLEAWLTLHLTLAKICIPEPWQSSLLPSYNRKVTRLLTIYV